MADEVPVVAPTPEPAPIVTPEPIPEPIEPRVDVPAPPEPLTAQIPANEPFDSVQDKPTPTPEPLPEPSVPIEPPPTPQPSTQASVIAPVVNYARDLAVKARAVIQSRKRKKLDKVLALIDAKKNIGNDDVEKLLHVSDATATRYLTQLEKEGKIIQVGKTGKSVRYVRS